MNTTTNGSTSKIGVLFAPCVFFLLKYREIIFSSNLRKTEKNIENISFIQKILPQNVILREFFSGIVKNCKDEHNERCLYLIQSLIVTK